MAPPIAEGEGHATSKNIAAVDRVQQRGTSATSGRYHQLEASDQDAAQTFPIMLGFPARALTDGARVCSCGTFFWLGVEIKEAALFVATDRQFAAAFRGVLPRHVASSSSLFWVTGRGMRHVGRGRPRG